jgi:hypothetical protein
MTRPHPMSRSADVPAAHARRIRRATRAYWGLPRGWRRIDAEREEHELLERIRRGEVIRVARRW